jgi:hypothetical protein
MLAASSADNREGESVGGALWKFCGGATSRDRDSVSHREPRVQTYHLTMK